MQGCNVNKFQTRKTKSWKLAYLITLFMLVHENSANISISSLMILVKILVFYKALVLSNLNISYLSSLMFTSSK